MMTYLHPAFQTVEPQDCFIEYADRNQGYLSRKYARQPLVVDTLD